MEATFVTVGLLCLFNLDPFALDVDPVLNPDTVLNLDTTLSVEFTSDLDSGLNFGTNVFLPGVTADFDDLDTNIPLDNTNIDTDVDLDLDILATEIAATDDTITDSAIPVNPTGEDVGGVGDVVTELQSQQGTEIGVRNLIPSPEEPPPSPSSTSPEPEVASPLPTTESGPEATDGTSPAPSPQSSSPTPTPSPTSNPAPATAGPNAGTQCPSDAVLLAGTCTVCSTATSMEECIACTNQDGTVVCTACQVPRVLSVDNKCIPCRKAIRGCRACVGSEVDVTCDQCIHKVLFLAPDKKACIPCAAFHKDGIKFCALCDASSGTLQCTRCKPALFFLSSDNLACHPCNDVSNGGISKCVRCAGGQGNVECRRCRRGFMPSADKSQCDPKP